MKAGIYQSYTGLAALTLGQLVLLFLVSDRVSGGAW